MKKIIIISAINIKDGGGLSILSGALEYANGSLSKDYKIIALINNKNIFEQEYLNIDFLEFGKFSRYTLIRLFIEYFYFRILSNTYKPFLWLSLNDITPNVNSKIRAVYRHNALMFYSMPIKNIFLQKKLFIQKMSYRWIYSLNMSTNDYVVVQQSWIKKAFVEKFHLPEEKVIVAYPSIYSSKSSKTEEKVKSKTFTFFYPCLPRVFKNIELIITATKFISRKYPEREFRIILTINGRENNYSKKIAKSLNGIKNVSLVGGLTRSEMNLQYKKSDCLIFPSHLETWGLPLSEAKEFGLPILSADLPYAHETINDYDQVLFFDVNNFRDLSDKMLLAMDMQFKKSSFSHPKDLFSSSWKTLFKILLTD